jgi:hypothetical protein
VSSFSTVRFKDIRRMLHQCAPGAAIEKKKHRHWVRYDGKIYRGLPLGRHGKRENPEIEIGHVRQLIRYFGIDEACARQAIPALG